MGDAAVGERRATGLIDDVFDVRGSHDTGVVNGHVHEDLVELDILLGLRGDQIVVLQPGDGEDRLTVQLGVVKAVEEVKPPGPEVARQTPSRPVYFA